MIRNSKYLDLIATFGVGGAHPGGFELTKELFINQNINRNTSILDVGCGTGQTVAYLAKKYRANITGIDVNSTMVEKAKARIKQDQLSIDILHCSIEKIPLPDHQFDLILSESVLSFVNKPTALSEIFRLLKHDGQLIANELTVNQALSPALQAELTEFYGFNSIPAEKDWVNDFRQAGFKTIHIRKPQLIKPYDSIPEFNISTNIKPKINEIMDQHYQMTLKYQDIWDYNIFICMK